MSRKLWSFVVSFVLSTVILVFGYAAYRLSGKNILAGIGAITLTYSLAKPIQLQVENWVEKGKKTRVSSIYSKNESDFEKEINEKIEELTNDGSVILSINVLSTKRAVIQYRI